jgi:hypothetical protein
MKEKEKKRLELANPFRRRKKVKVSEVEDPVEVKHPTKSAHDLIAKATYGSSTKR